MGRYFFPPHVCDVCVKCFSCLYRIFSGLNPVGRHFPDGKKILLPQNPLNETRSKRRWHTNWFNFVDNYKMSSGAIGFCNKKNRSCVRKHFFSTFQTKNNELRGLFSKTSSDIWLTFLPDVLINVGIRKPVAILHLRQPGLCVWA